MVELFRGWPTEPPPLHGQFELSTGDAGVERALAQMSAGGPLGPQLQRYREITRQRQITLEELLMENRIVFLASPIDMNSAIRITMQLLYLQYENKNQAIHFYIFSPGGLVMATLAIYDTMQFLECPISTYCLGLAASGAAWLLAAGAKGKRFALPNSKIMIHQPRGGVGGQISDIEIEVNEMIKDRQRLNQIMAKHTGQPMDKIEFETDRDRWFSPQEAKEFGLVDEVITTISEEQPKK
jgi:ATP-dependent Clp protease protease subunit